jgi:hypothetical protein
MLLLPVSYGAVLFSVSCRLWTPDRRGPEREGLLGLQNHFPVGPRPYLARLGFWIVTSSSLTMSVINQIFN